jgi:serine/threonine protein kinase
MPPEAPNPLPPLAPGMTYAIRYRLKRRLGSGRLGETWLAEDTRLEMEVVLKFFDAVKNTRFLEATARRCMKIIHPHIVRIFEYLDEEGRRALVMEYLEGGSLARQLKEKDEGCYEAHELQTWLRQLWSALADLHQEQLDHGNLNLANLGIAGTGELKIMEAGFFNIRAMSLSPEQIYSYLPCLTPQLLDDGQPGPEDDCYAAAACTYELLTGKPVFLGSANLAAQIRTETPAAVAVRRAEIGVGQTAVPKAWEAWIAQCLAKDASTRPSAASVRDLLRAERRIGSTGKTTHSHSTTSGQTSPQAPAKPAWPPAWMPQLPQQGWLGIGAAAAVAVFLLTSWLPAQRRLTAMEEAFAQLRAKNASEPPATVASLWADFQKAYDSPIPYTSLDSDMLADAADFQFTYQEKADALLRAQKLAEERAERDRRERLSKLAAAASDLLEQTRQSFSDRATAAQNAEGWKQALMTLMAKAASLTDGEDLPVIVKETKKNIEAEIARWTAEHENEMRTATNALGRLSMAVESLQAFVDNPNLSALAKKAQVERLLAEFSSLTPEIRSSQGVTPLLTQLQTLQQHWSTAAANLPPPDLRALFAETSYASLNDAQLKAVVSKVYAAYNIDPKSDPELRQLQQAIVAGQMKSDPTAATGRLTPAQLQSLNLPAQMSAEELEKLVPKEAAPTVRKTVRTVKKTVEEEKPGFWRGLGNKAKGIFGGGKDEKK